MEATLKKPVIKTADDLIHYMLESKKQSKKESRKFAKTNEFQEVLKKLRAMKLQQS